jgi:hypothetical protein
MTRRYLWAIVAQFRHNPCSRIKVRRLRFGEKQYRELSLRCHWLP